MTMTATPYTPPSTSSGFTMPNVQSAAFWSALAGVASVVCGALNVSSSLSGAIRNVLIAVGGVLIAIPAHHVIGKQQGTLPTAAPSPAPKS